MAKIVPSAIIGKPVRARRNSEAPRAPPTSDNMFDTEILLGVLRASTDAAMQKRITRRRIPGSSRVGSRDAQARSRMGS
jgi:hypothetical protein